MNKFEGVRRFVRVSQFQFSKNQVEKMVLKSDYGILLLLRDSIFVVLY